MTESLDDFVPDLEREARTGLDESIFCAAKTTEQIAKIILRLSKSPSRRVLLTRLDVAKFEQLPSHASSKITYDPLSRTATIGAASKNKYKTDVAIVSGGTSDAAVVAEVERTLAYYGVGAVTFQDLGVAGLWRLLDQVSVLAKFPIIIAVAGMEASLPTVLAGLVPSAIIAVPTSVGYGVAEGGGAALNSLLASCAPGLVVVNIDNGYGAACAALRFLNACGQKNGEFSHENGHNEAGSVY